MVPIIWIFTDFFQKKCVEVLKSNGKALHNYCHYYYFMPSVVKLLLLLYAPQTSSRKALYIINKINRGIGESRLHVLSTK